MLQRFLIAAAALLIASGIVWAIAGGSDGPSASERVTSPLEKRAVRIEKKAAADPQNEALKAAAMRTWIRAGGNELETIDPRTQPIPEAVVPDYEAGLRLWTDHLKQTGGKPTTRLAEIAGVVYFQLVEIGSRDPRQATANAAGAARAQAIVGRREPSLYTLSDLATYLYFAGENAAGDRAADGAVADAARTGAGAKSARIQLDEFKERGEKFVGRVRRGLQTLEETGEDELETPIKGYGTPAGLNGYEPGTGPSS